MNNDSISLTIDGKEIHARDGQTIMQVARDADLSIPSLCDSSELKGFGSCRNLRALAPAECVWWRSKDAEGQQRPAPLLRQTAWW